MMFKSESELAAAVVAWLKDMHWTVYQEVQMMRGDGIADIVATQNKRLWVVETKLSFSLAVIEQANNWKAWAHYTSIAIPSSQTRRSPRGRIVGEMLCRYLGIGIIKVENWGDGRSQPREAVEPPLNRHIIEGLAESLCDEQLIRSVAGSISGGHWTPFKSTCRDVLGYVRNHPGCTMKELLTHVQTHYASVASARSCLPGWIEEGKVPGVELRREGRKMFLHPKEKK